ncbi:MAG: sugar ABC transporter ATP-binding protein [Planctomycetota bacterium]|jgi:ribose transport system ATP-binding protein|nr:sugar ABC transporter ATP-binding protein [Planctomycetota bacterium]
METHSLLFSASKMAKRYPGTTALNAVELEVRPGEIVGLVGENGAGKSTLLKLIMGIEQPTEGAMAMRGEAYAPRTPIEANGMGVGMVFQEQSLIQNLTVGQNVFFGLEASYVRCGFLDKRRMYEDTRKILGEIGIDYIRPDKKVSNLDFATRQMVEIAKVFSVVTRRNAGGNLILLDEPTSVLNRSEVDNLFDNMRRMAAGGNSVIFVSHRLDEVLDVSDRIYVFKDGRNAALLDRKDANEAILYEKMVGKTVSGEYYKEDRQAVPGDEVLLEARNLGRRGFFGGVNLKLRRGEVVGVCGSIGSGKEDLCAVVCGDESYTAGELVVKGRVERFASPRQALKAGVLSIPKERREEGIIAEAPIYENIAMSNFRAFRRFGCVSARLERENARRRVDELSIRTPGINQSVGFLSGGNAQKVVFARILSSDADVLVLNHPTRGVDVGAKEEIYSLIRDITASGKGMILLGDTLDECIGLASRIIVMKDGLVTREFDAPAGAKPEQLEIVKYMV